MEEIRNKKICSPEKILVFKDGKIYFSKNTERRLFFVLTLMMLLSGIMYKLELF